MEVFHEDGDEEFPAYEQIPGYTTDEHEVRLTPIEIDLLVFAAGKVLGHVEKASQAMLPEGHTYGLTEPARVRLVELLDRLLDLSETFK